MQYELKMNQKELKALLHYDPKSGIFTWRQTGTGRKRKEAGCTCKATGYHNITINWKSYPAHHLAFLYMRGRFPIRHVDHKDHIRNNNIWGNLREADEQMIAKNRTLRCDNSSKVQGVVWSKDKKRWRARINTPDKKRIHLGYFRLFQKAVAVRKAAEVVFDYHPNHGKKNMKYQLKIIYEASRPSEIWGDYDSREEAVDVMQRAEGYPSVVDIILIPVVD